MPNLYLRKGGKNYYSPLVDVTSTRASDLIIRHGGQNYAVAEIPGTQVGNLDLYDLAGNTWTVTGSPVLTADKAKFGGKSFYINTPSSNYIRTQNFEIPDRHHFTVDLWVCMTKVPSLDVAICSLAQPETKFQDGSGLSIDCSNQNLTVFWSSGFGNWDLCLRKPFGTFTLGKWHHAALVKNGTQVYMFWDGILTQSFKQSATFYGDQKAVFVGDVSNWSRSVTAYVDELRISNCARWTADFTPPTAQYTLDDNTLALLRAK